MACRERKEEARTICDFLGLTTTLNKLAFPHSTPYRKAKALYACKAEHDSELSFTAGTVFDNGEFPVPSQTWREAEG